MRKFIIPRYQNIQIFSRSLAKLHVPPLNPAGNSTMTENATAKPKQKLNVHSFPRPPLCEKTDRELRLVWNDAVIAETKAGEAYWVLETTHPPSEYLNAFPISRSYPSTWSCHHWLHAYF